MGATATLLRFAPMGTTATPLTPALLTGTTALRGLAAASSSVPVPGSVVVMAMDTVASTVIAADITDTVAGTGTEVAMVMAVDTMEDTLAVITVPQ